MLKRIMLSIALAALASVSFAAGKTCYINMEKVFNDYYKTVNENIGFEVQRRKFIDGMMLMREEYQNAVTEFRKAQGEMNNDLLSAESRDAAKLRAQALAQRIEQKQGEIMRYRSDSLGEIDAKQQAAVETLIGELKGQIQKFCQEKKITLLLDVSGKTMNRMPTILVYPEDEEITQVIIMRINAGHEKERSEAEVKLSEMRKKNGELMRAYGPAGMVPAGN